MQIGTPAFTAVFLKAKHGYVGFIEELPNVNAHGHTIDEARTTLQNLVALIFAEERRSAHEMTAGKEGVREAVFIPREPAQEARGGACAAAGCGRRERRPARARSP